MPACTSTHRFAQTWLQQTVRDSPPRCANYEGLSLQGFHTITELHPVTALLSQQWIIICLTLLHFPHSHKVWLCEKRHNLETRNLLIIGHIDPPSLLFFFFFVQAITGISLGSLYDTGFIDYAYVPSACSSHSCERNISIGNFFTFGTNLHLISTITWLDFGCQRSTSAWHFILRKMSGVMGCQSSTHASFKTLKMYFSTMFTS